MTPERSISRLIEFVDGYFGTEHWPEWLPPRGDVMGAIREAETAARAEAFEEAAKIAERDADCAAPSEPTDGHRIASAIRKKAKGE